MAASENDLFLRVGNPGTATTLSAPGYTIGATSINVASTTNFPSATGVIFAIDQAEVVDGEEVQVAGTYCVFSGKVASATSLDGLTLEYGTPQNYSAGALTRVYITVSAIHNERLIDGLTAQHSQLDGTHTAVTATSVNVSGTITTDTINENTAAAGVTIDGLNIKDGALTTAGSVSSENLNATIAFRGTTTQAITNSASPTDITTYTEVFDLGADFSHTTGKFTCPLTGVYHFSVSGGFQDNASTDARMGIFIENRTTTTDLCGQYARTGATNHDPIISTSVTTLCTAGDEIIAKMYQDIGTESLVSPSNFSGFFVGA